MVSLFTLYTIVLGLFELPTVVLLLAYDRPVHEVTPWFDSVAPLERRSYAYMYASVLILLMISRFLSAYLPRHLLLQIHNAILHALEIPLYFSLFSLKQNPISPPCYVLLAFMVGNCILFGFHAFTVLKLRTKTSIDEKKKNK
ncbi:hypothetical protein LSM04_002426 [Trypanosoma melophagium]|uniref:uncharacterized protein n=1 Tax=Trypanosoma melophagium TaxID=715481 RepID=UPI00351A6613|nr:hypothetical protein LSM04_002426 [Trypanosoma melophagium]